MIRDQRHYEWTERTGAAIKALVESLVPLSVKLTSTGNGADTTEDTLLSYSIPAATMGANGVQGFEIEAWGTTAANGDNKVIKIYFGSAVMSMGTITDSAKNWWMKMQVWRTGTNTQVVVAKAQHDTTMVTPTVTTATETETGAITAKVTGQNSSNATANTVVAKAFTVRAIEQKNAA